ncbi:hypothetical protein Q0F98_33350 [Paenibacillus amylolyticus]|nr:hypothetical protein Q0F98_33350 [Paenibacillus amylolyticus]
MLNAEYDDRKDVLYMYYEYNPYLSYGEDRSFQLPPLFPGGGGGTPGGQTFPGTPGGQGSYPPYIPGGGPGPYIPEAFRVHSRVQQRAYLRNWRKAICPPCLVPILVR